MLDAAKIIRELLVRPNTTLYAQVGTRVYCPMAPATFRNTEKAIVFRVVGGAREFVLDAASVTAELMCFGGDGTSPSWAKAEAVHAALLETVCGNANVNVECTSGRVIAVEEGMTGQQVIQKDTSYPYVWISLDIELAAL